MRIYLITIAIDLISAALLDPRDHVIEYPKLDYVFGSIPCKETRDCKDYLVLA